jgi:hypothetical protein
MYIQLHVVCTSYYEHNYVLFFISRHTGAINLIASDAVWNAVPGNITNLADVLSQATATAPQYRARPDYDPPASLDPAATAVELSAGSWRWIICISHISY